MSGNNTECVLFYKSKRGASIRRVVIRLKKKTIFIKYHTMDDYLPKIVCYLFTGVNIIIKSFDPETPPPRLHPFNIHSYVPNRRCAHSSYFWSHVLSCSVVFFQSEFSVASSCRFVVASGESNKTG